MMQWSALVPQKAFSRAKGRVEIDPGSRGALARAMLRDTVAALRATSAISRVAVLFDDPADASALPSSEAVDVRGLGLNGSIREGVEIMRRRNGLRGVVVVPSDLPALDHLEMTVFLSLAEQHERSFLRDRGGVGTTLLTAMGSHPLLAAYGTDSARRHAASGAVDLSSHGLRSLRSDIDDLASLAGAVQMGCGPNTLAWCADRRTVLDAG